MKYWIRDNKWEFGSALFMITVILVTIIAWSWSVISGEIHTAWEVIFLLVCVGGILSTVYLMVYGIRMAIQWGKTLHWSKHSKSYIIAHRPIWAVKKLIKAIRTR